MKSPDERYKACKWCDEPFGFMRPSITENNGDIHCYTTHCRYYDSR